MPEENKLFRLHLQDEMPGETGLENASGFENESEPSQPHRERLETPEEDFENASGSERAILEGAGFGSENGDGPPPW